MKNESQNRCLQPAHMSPMKPYVALSWKLEQTTFQDAWKNTVGPRTGQREARPSEMARSLGPSRTGETGAHPPGFSRRPIGWGKGAAKEIGRRGKGKE